MHYAHVENRMKQQNIFYYIVKIILYKEIFFLHEFEKLTDLPIDELTLLFGNEILNDEKNTQIFLQVQKFIQDTGRFTIK